MIVLIGFMGSGKTTVGRIVAAKVGLPFFDTDDLLESQAGMPLAEIFRTKGEPHFRGLEREAVLDALSGREAVISLGGGSVGDPAVATALQGKNVVHLEVSYGEAMRRTGGDPARPMLHGDDPKALFEKRLGVYKMLAKKSVDTSHRSPDEIALEIAIAVKGSAVAAEQVQKVVVPLGDRSYDVVVGRDLLGRFPGYVPGLEGTEQAFVVSHPNLDRFAKEVEAALGDRGISVHQLRLEEGEASKSLDVAARLWGELAEKRAHRSDLVVAIGGGVVSDVAGFVAATYNRGMPLVHVPTTLLGQVDAAIGGKAGVNIPQGKNLIGTIYQPRSVLCDVDVLASLPEEEFRSGMAEVVKYGLIADPDLLDGIGRTYQLVYDGNSRVLVETVARSAAIKASFVASDEGDRGKRMFLNYGHTFAHAIERMEGFNIRHGEAVSLGMMAAAYLSEEVAGLSEYGVEVHRRSLSDVGLPITAELDLDALEDAWQHDKKYRNGVRFVLLDDIGSPRADVEAPRGAVGAALRRLAG